MWSLRKWLALFSIVFRVLRNVAIVSENVLKRKTVITLTQRHCDRNLTLILNLTLTQSHWEPNLTEMLPKLIRLLNYLAHVVQQLFITLQDHEDRTVDL